MKPAILLCILLLSGPSIIDAAKKKMTVEVVSVSESTTTVDGTPVDNFLAKIILPDGSHALAGCEEIIGGSPKVCDLDNGYPERLKRTQENGNTITTGYPKFEATRNGKELTIYTAAGKRTYFIVNFW
jgi:hypothetical protein